MTTVTLGNVSTIPIQKEKKMFHWFSWETFLAYSSTGPCKPTNTQELKRCSKLGTS